MSEKKTAKESKVKNAPKEISRRQFLTGTTEGAISYGVFEHPVARFLTAFTSTLDVQKQKEEQNKRMLEQAKHSAGLEKKNMK